MLSRVWPSVAQWAVVHQAPLPMGFSQQEYRSVFPFPPQDLPNPGIKLTSLVLQADSLPLSHLGSPPVTSVTTLFPNKVTFWGIKLGLQCNFSKDAIQTVIHLFSLLFCYYSSHLLIPVSFYIVRFFFTLFSKMLVIFLSWPSHTWLVAACSQSKTVPFCSSLDFSLQNSPHSLFRIIFILPLLLLNYESFCLLSFIPFYSETFSLSLGWPLVDISWSSERPEKVVLPI